MKKPIILCVDDEKVVLTSLKAQLKRHFGNEYIIETAENGDDAFDFVNEIIENGDELPVIVSDHIMPGMKGDELLINVYNKLPKTLSIMLTGQADAEAVGNALNRAKLYRYISKPWEETDLKMTIAEAIRSYFQEKKIEDQNKELEKLVQQLKEHNTTLEQKVKERTIQLSERNKELQQRNEEIKLQRDEITKKSELLEQQNEEIKTQSEIVNEQNVKIIDSILYAKKIQSAVLPQHAYIDEILPENFILFKPRDVVSGDFYWVKQVSHYIIVAVADCTGHGVPGAFMSMLGISFMNEIVQKRKIIQTNQALNELRKQTKQALRQTGKKGEADDGMDIALCAFDTKTKMLQYSGANNSLYLIQDGELIEIKADRMPIGFYPNEKPSFTNHDIQLKEGDIFYLFSDGFSDQFGGEKGFKYKTANFKKTLFENHQKPMIIQKELLEQELDNWMKGFEQTDDILVMGVRV